MAIINMTASQLRRQEAKHRNRTLSHNLDAQLDRNGALITNCHTWDVSLSSSSQLLLLVDAKNTFDNPFNISLETVSMTSPSSPP